MANNLDVKDAAGATRTVKTTDNAGVHTPSQNVDQLASGQTAHDAAASGNPLRVAGRSSAAAPAAVSADGDAVEAWYLRNGAAMVGLQAAGALVGGDAANGLDVDVTRLPALAAGTNAIGRVGLDPQTAGGLSTSRVISAASTNATSVKGSAGQVYGIYAHNINAAARYLKLYNKASAPTVGSDTPLLTLPIPGNAAGAGFVLAQAIGIEFATGIALALTTGVADADTGAVAANEITVNLLYK